MFEQFSDDGVICVKRAEAVARRLRTNISAQLLFICILDTDKDLASVVADLGIDLPCIKQRVEGLERNLALNLDDVSFTDACNHILDLSVELSKETGGRDLVCPHHLLLAFARQRKFDVFSAIGVDLEEFPQALDKALSSKQE